MEAIKFSELPSGDRMPLADEDGAPIIANQENRLLTWGRLKQQIAAQTHTDTVDESEKIPTAKAVSDALGSLNSDLHDEFDEKIDDAQAKAEGANATAKSALASAGSASRDAQSAENKAAEAVSKVAEATSAAKTAESKAEEAKNAANGVVAIAESAKSLAEEAKGATEKIDLEPLKQQLETIGTYAAWRVEITAGSIDDANGLMTGAPSISETTEGIDESLPVAETLALIFRNQEAIYQILMDTRKRAIANAANLTAMLTNINAVLSQVMN